MMIWLLWIVLILAFAFGVAVVLCRMGWLGAIQENDEAWRVVRNRDDEILDLKESARKASDQIAKNEDDLKLAYETLNAVRECDECPKLRSQLEAAAGRDKQHTIELGQRRGEVQRLQQELAEAVREADIHRNGAEELRKQLKEAKDRHAADVALVNQLTVERDRLTRRMLNIADMARTGKGVEVQPGLTRMDLGNGSSILVETTDVGKEHA